MAVVTAPPCFVPVTAPAGSPQPANIPAIAPLQTVDLPDMQAAINQVIHTINVMNGNSGGMPFDNPRPNFNNGGGGGGGGGVGGGVGARANLKPDKKKAAQAKWHEDKSKRRKGTVRIHNPSNPKQFVDVERIDSFTMIKQTPATENSPPVTEDTFTWNR